VKRSFSTKERKALIDQLQYWNTALKNCFERPEVPAEDEDTKVQELQARFNPKHCDSIRENVQAIHGVLKDGWNCMCPCSHHAAIDLDWQPEMPTLPSVFDIALSFQDTSTQKAAAKYCWRKLQIKIEKTDSGNVTPIAQPVLSPQSSRAPPPMPLTSSGKNKLSGLFGRRQNKKSKQVTVAVPPYPGGFIVAVLTKEYNSWLILKSKQCNLPYQLPVQPTTRSHAFALGCGRILGHP
jgi:hypothetical protein